MGHICKEGALGLIGILRPLLGLHDLSHIGQNDAYALVCLPLVETQIHLVNVGLPPLVGCQKV